MHLSTSPTSLLVRVGLTTLILGALWLSLQAVPRMRASTYQNAEAAPSCPIVVRAAFGPNTDAQIAAQIESAFESFWPGTDLQLQPFTSLSAINLAFIQGTVDIGLLTTPFLGTFEVPEGVGQWHVAAGLWIAVPKAAMTVSVGERALSRIDVSSQVRADDLVNYLRFGPGVALLQSQGQVPIQPPMARAPFPDWDHNLDGGTSLGDLGGPSSRWGQTTACKGWIRADVNNSTNVSLSDIGGVTNKWGRLGYSCEQCSNDNYWSALGGMYSYASDEGCTGNADEADPVTTILLSAEVGVEPVRQQIEDEFTAAGLNHGFWQLFGVDWWEIIGYQDYYENGNCWPGELTQSTSDQECGPEPQFPCAERQWHVRCNVVDHSAPFGYWAACTPHWDELAGCPDKPDGGHYVPPLWHGHGNEDEWGWWDGSGFDAARDWLWIQLVQNQGHQFIGLMDYGNTRPLQQCNGEWTQADGKVNVIRLID